MFPQSLVVRVEGLTCLSSLIWAPIAPYRDAKISPLLVRGQAHLENSCN
jgi:hypothetical protein